MIIMMISRLEPAEERHEASGALSRVADEARGLGAEVKVLHQHAEVGRGGHRVGLQVDQGRPVEQRVEQEDEEEAKEHLHKQMQALTTARKVCNCNGVLLSLSTEFTLAPFLMNTSMQSLSPFSLA